MAAPSDRVLPPVTSSQQHVAAVGKQAARVANTLKEGQEETRSHRSAGSGHPPTPTIPDNQLGESVAPQPPVTAPAKTTLGQLAEALTRGKDDATESLDEFDAGQFLKTRVKQQRRTGAALAGAVLGKMRRKA